MTVSIPICIGEQKYKVVFDSINEKEEYLKKEANFCSAERNKRITCAFKDIKEAKDTLAAKQLEFASLESFTATLADKYILFKSKKGDICA